MTSSTAAYQPAMAKKSRGPMLIKSTLFGGVILFAWQFLSWGVLPLRKAVLQSFSDEDSMSAAIRANASAPGIYILPLVRDMSGASDQAKAAAEKRAAEGPIVFASVRLGPVRPFAFGLTAQFLTQLVIAFFISIVLLKTNITTYSSKILFIATIALLAGIAGHIPNWNWFNFSPGYTALEMTDLLVGWTLAGLAIAKFIH